MPCLSWRCGAAQRRHGQLYDLLSVRHQCTALFHGKRISHVFQILSSLFLCASQNQKSSYPRDWLEYSDPDSCHGRQTQICKSHYSVPEKPFSAGLSVALLVLRLPDADLSGHASVTPAPSQPYPRPLTALHASCPLQHLSLPVIHAARLQYTAICSPDAPSLDMAFLFPLWWSVCC